MTKRRRPGSAAPWLIHAAVDVWRRYRLHPAKPFGVLVHLRPPVHCADGWPSRRTRLGILGFGTIGAALYRQVLAEPGLGLEVAFVHSRAGHRLQGVPEALRLADPGDRDVLVRHPP